MAWYGVHNLIYMFTFLNLIKVIYIYDKCQGHWSIYRSRTQTYLIIHLWSVLLVQLYDNPKANQYILFILNLKREIKPTVA